MRDELLLTPDDAGDDETRRALEAAWEARRTGRSPLLALRRDGWLTPDEAEGIDSDP